MYRYVHGEHTDKESPTKYNNGLEVLFSSYEPCETENNRPYDKDCYYVSRERRLSMSWTYSLASWVRDEDDTIKLYERPIH